MNQNQPKSNKVLWWIIGGILFLVVSLLIIYTVIQTNKAKETSFNQKPTESNNKPGQTGNSSTTSKEELEKYLLEKRLDLQKYFVFCLQKEVKPGKVAITNQVNANNGRNIVPSLSNHLSKLIGERKDWIIFSGKYTNETSEEWNKDKLDQKIKNGEEWYIIFDKSQINSETCNYFSKLAGIGGTTFPTGIVLAVEAEPEVQIKKTKKETLDFLKKNDPILQEKF
ncbi:hypothetical protein [endosymbiont GvMRE of Glomus versiforme]|uniref:hypothetical protein n=1 Tax=endosymbiont GvMRE of Glomus versiforme TaxID=2039283 RepID=UPI000ED5ABA4|nr:hypothetical protein [endosymbiont GvMRE of Glomus versiforme]RHZ36399.1 hypothetical protein GvMRE_Ic1g174 [endosymbiont GvMRE of Glomus versiforme]